MAGRNVRQLDFVRPERTSPDNETVQFTGKQRLLLRVVPPVATLLIRVLCRTLRFEDTVGEGARPADKQTGGDLYGFWHRSLLMAAYRYRGLRIAILISASFDGELIARVVERLGFVPVRGSSTRGGAVGLLGMDRAMRDGMKVAITADGPKGPVYVAKPGLISAALRAARRNGGTSEVSVFHIHPDRSWTLRSWDGFLVPKPFSRVRCAWPTPVHVRSDEPAEEALARVQAAMDLAVAMAEEGSRGAGL